MPGNPAEAMMSRFKGRINPEALKALEVAFGINTQDSVWHQYLDYLRNSFTGQFGTSLSFFPVSVNTVIRQALPWTVGLVGITTLLAFIFGTLIGTVAGWRRGGAVDSVLPPVFVITSALPYFWVGMVLILLLSVKTSGALPNDGGYDTALDAGWNGQFVTSVLQHALLPGLTILIVSIGGWILTMRNNMVTTLAEDYIRMGRAKGLSNSRIMLDYAAHNAILPNLSGFAMSLGFVVSGSVLTEFTFNYPGVGYMFLSAVSNQDYPLMQALFVLITVAVLVAVLLSDFATVWLDPRARTEA
jgi:peptide/nickel transport system permease protein